ncbi:MAG: FeoA family protein [Bacillota bacterium]|nr:FeoA family protein [Bacillota bacterium]
MKLSLVDMKPGQNGVIEKIMGGPGFAAKLGQIGLYRGKKIKKLSSIFRRGPVTVSIDNFQVAIGYGKAMRIMVEVDDGEENSAGW